MPRHKQPKVYNEGDDMMTSESPMMVELLRDHREQLLREAENERLCALTPDAESQRGWTRFRYGVGDLLITLGQRMKG
jgi:hypothetical protein